VTDPRDPIETWLGADVELLPPRQGEFDRIHHRARRRRATTALTAAASAAVVIVAAAVLPQVAGGLFQGHGAPTNIGGTTTTPARSHSPRQPTSSPKPRSSAIHTVPPSPGAALPPAGAAASAPAAAGFQPASVTFVGQDVGAAIGQTARCAASPCTVVAGTPDYGTSWTAMGTPGGTPGTVSGVSQIRFLDLRYGWAFGPALYATDDGGATWHAEHLPGRVIDLSTVDSRAYAVVAQCAGSYAPSAELCSSFALYASAAGSGTWSRVPGAAGDGSEIPGGLQLTVKNAGYLIAGGHLFTGSVSAGGWHQVPSNSTTPPCLQGPGQHAASLPGPALLAPATASQLYLACDAAGSAGTAGRLTLYVSSDSGQTWQVNGPIAARGQATSIADIAGAEIVLATTDGLDYSTDGVHWSQASLSARAPHGFSFVGMSFATQGVAVPADVRLGELFITKDGGKTWQAHKIG
jgi:photosystem II stability/assembly factor-like uncharacterized protein